MRGIGDVAEPDFGPPGDFLSSDPDDNQGDAGKRGLVGRRGDRVRSPGLSRFVRR